MIDTDAAWGLLSASQLTEDLNCGKIGSRELLLHYRDRIERLNPAINAVVTLDDTALARAVEADSAQARGETWGPLHGLPITIKDSLETAGLRTTAGAEEFADHVPTRDADAVARLRGATSVSPSTSWPVRTRRVRPPGGLSCRPLARPRCVTIGSQSGSRTTTAPSTQKSSRCSEL